MVEGVLGPPPHSASRVSRHTGLRNRCRGLRWFQGFGERLHKGHRSCTLGVRCLRKPPNILNFINELRCKQKMSQKRSAGSPEHVSVVQTGQTAEVNSQIVSLQSASQECTNGLKDSDCPVNCGLSMRFRNNKVCHGVLHRLLHLATPTACLQTPNPVSHGALVEFRSMCVTGAGLGHEGAGCRGSARPCLQ